MSAREFHGRKLGVKWRTFAVSRGHCRSVKNIEIIGLSPDFLRSPNGFSWKQLLQLVQSVLALVGPGLRDC